MNQSAVTETIAGRAVFSLGPCLIRENFWLWDTVALSFVFVN
jgi:hypothetical protein